VLTATGMALASTGAGGGLLVLFLALPPFQFGWWYQSEPVAIGLHAAAAVAALGVILLVLARGRRSVKLVMHPLMLLPAALGFWSALTAAFAPLPSLSWLGTPELGQGIVWHFDLAVLIAAALHIQRVPRLRRILAWIAVASAAVAAALTLHTQQHWAWAPFWFYDYLAFFGLYLPIIVLAGLRPRRRVWRHAAVIGGLAIVVVSGNRAAIALVLTAGPAMWLLMQLLRHRPGWMRPAATAAAIVAPLVVAAAVHLAGSRAVDAGVQSRYYHQLTVMRTLAGEPFLLATGQGWGHYAAALIANMPIERVDFFGFDGRADWDGVRRQVHFHTHNFVTEGLVAAGVVGAALAWLFPAAIARFSARRWRVHCAVLAVLLAGLLAVWFQLPGSVPFAALAAASIAGPRLPRVVPVPKVPYVVVPLVAVLAVQSYAAYAATSGAVAATLMAEANAAALSGEPGTDDGCEATAPDDGRGDVHLSVALRSFSAALTSKAEDGAPPTAGEVRRLGDLLCAADARLARRSSLRLAVVNLLVTADLAFSLRHPAFEPVRSQALAHWRDHLDAFLAVAPDRTDMAYLHLTWLTERGAHDAIRKLAARLLAHDGNDPVGLWFSGATMLEEPDTASEGLDRLVRSLDAGIGRLMDIDDATERRIREAAAGR